MKRRPGQHDDETAIEYMRRVVNNCNYEPESMLDQLPSVVAVLEYFELWHEYGTDFWEGILEGIASGDDSAKARAFVKRWKLKRGWLASIREAEQIHARAQKANAS